jgi:hypothetical protein
MPNKRSNRFQEGKSAEAVKSLWVEPIGCF